MEETSKLKVALKYGGLLGLSQIILSMISYLLGFNEPGNTMGSVISFISFALIAWALYAGMKAFRTANKSLSIGDGVVIGLLLALVAGLINAVYLYVYCTALDPTFLENLLDETASNLPEMDPDQEDATMAMYDKIFSPAGMSATTLITYFFIGLIGGLIMGLIMKEESTEYPDLLA